MRYVALGFLGWLIVVAAPLSAREALPCGHWSAAFRGGVTPATFTKRGDLLLVTQGRIVPPVVDRIGGVHQFCDLFDTPWQVGAEVAWNASRHIQLFVEYAYNRASGKMAQRTFTQINYGSDLSAYSSHNAYLGVRYYLCSLCRCVRLIPYIGMKGGFSWQERVDHSFSIAGIQASSSAAWFDGRTAPGVGGMLGLEWWFCRCWSAVLQGEIVAAQGLRGNANVPLNNQTITNLSVGQTGWLLSFPVTLGLRWTF